MTFEQRSIELEIQQQVRNAFRSYGAAKKEVEVFKRDVLDQAAENLKLMETAYQQGKIDLFQVVIVQNDLVNAQFSYLESLWSYWQARTELEKAIGRDL